MSYVFSGFSGITDEDIRVWQTSPLRAKIKAWYDPLPGAMKRYIAGETQFNYNMPDALSKLKALSASGRWYSKTKGWQEETAEQARMRADARRLIKQLFDSLEPEVVAATKTSLEKDAEAKGLTVEAYLAEIAARKGVPPPSVVRKEEEKAPPPPPEAEKTFTDTLKENALWIALGAGALVLVLASRKK